MNIDQKLHESYVNTDYVIEANETQIVVRIHECSTALDSALAAAGCSSAAFITAWNPGSELMSQSDNEAAHRALGRHLKQEGCSWFIAYADSRTGEWPREEGVLVLGVTLDFAEQVAKRFRQKAFLFMSIQNPVKLLYTGY